MDELDFASLEKSLGIQFKDNKYLERALTHRSYINETGDEVKVSNERLEFLGDAVLQFLTSEYIYKQYPDYPEGELTNLRSRLVNTTSLAKESARLGVSEHLYISKGERETASESDHILANTFEAILGAIYLDQGIDACRGFLDTQLLYKTELIIEQGDLKDPKSLFQELAQEKYSITPVYRVIKDEGPDHNKVFNVGVYLDKKLVADGTGSSKRRAQQDAARKALSRDKLVTLG